MTANNTVTIVLAITVRLEMLITFKHLYNSFIHSTEITVVVVVVVAIVVVIFVKR